MSHIPFDTRDVKKHSAPNNPSGKPNTIKGMGTMVKDIEDEKFVHKEVNTEPGKVLEKIRNEVGMSRKDLATRLAIKENLIG